MLIERYNEVKKHVEEACKRVGRDPREVTAVSYTHLTLPTTSRV